MSRLTSARGLLSKPQWTWTPWVWRCLDDLKSSQPVNSWDLGIMGRELSRLSLRLQPRHGRIRAENTWLQQLPNGDCKAFVTFVI